MPSGSNRNDPAGITALTGEGGVTPLKADWAWKLRRDGGRWRATGPDFVNVVVSPAGYGKTKDEAVADFAAQRPNVPHASMFKVFPDVP